MKKEPFLWITISISLMANLVLLFALNNQQGNLQRNYKFDDGYIQTVMDIASLHMFVDGAELKNIPVYKHIKKKNYKQKQDSFLLHNILQEKKILFYFPKTYCDGCVSEQLFQLNKIGKEIGFENVIILTDQVIQKHADYILYNNIESEIYETKGEDIGIILPNRNGEYLPVFMVLNGSRIETSYVLSAETMDYTNYFYNKVKELMRSVIEQKDK